MLDAEAEAWPGPHAGGRADPRQGWGHTCIGRDTAGVGGQSHPDSPCGGGSGSSLCQICAQLWQREKLWVRLRWGLLWDTALVLVSIPLRKRGTPGTSEVCTHPRAAQGHGEAGCSHHDAACSPRVLGSTEMATSPPHALIEHIHQLSPLIRAQGSASTTDTLLLPAAEEQASQKQGTPGSSHLSAGPHGAAQPCLPWRSE